MHQQYAIGIQNCILSVASASISAQPRSLFAFRQFEASSDKNTLEFSNAV